MHANFYRRHAKRWMDFTVSLVAAIVFGPLVAIVAILVWLRLGRPVLFRQERAGLGGKPFGLYKFRSMNDSQDDTGSSLSDAERLTPFGEFIRGASLDELPQLWNVIRGDMSLVGPRPLLVRYLDRYNQNQARRHDVRPGLTGWAQIQGRNSLSWEEKFEHDVWYVENISLGLDTRILLATIPRLWRSDDVSAAGHATAPEFIGSREKHKP